MTATGPSSCLELNVRSRSLGARSARIGVPSNQNINRHRVSKDEVRGRLEKARAHVEFVVKLYQS
eukprot:15434932-Alexandrium_andersonii.AAC.1